MMFADYYTDIFNGFCKVFQGDEEAKAKGKEAMPGCADKVMGFFES